ncbi:MAG TPA: phosphotransferase [Candidatus Limnocylindrales bacterium]|nr:phosphotransferase [Candidatus Limnocylindrales bacterium]
MEEPLLGGAVSGPVRVGDTVRRPRACEAVHRVLRHLERVGFDGAPRLIGSDDQGRDILSFVPGEVMFGPSLTEAAVDSAARLIRRFHEAVAGLAVDGYEAPINICACEATRCVHRVVCHNDLSPRNTIFRDGEAVVLIDWDFVGMGPPLWDVAHAVWQFVLTDGPASVEPARRLDVFADAYSLSAYERDALLPAVVTRMLASADGIDRRAAAGEPAFVRLAGQGVPETIRAHADWVARWTP